MIKSLEKLLSIQDKDIRIFNLRKQINSVPEEKKKISEILTLGEDRYAKVKQEVIGIEKEIKSVEIEIAAKKEKKNALQAKSNEIKKNEEYKAFLNEVKDFDQKISVLEDSQLELWEKLEVSKSKLAAEKKGCDAAKARVEAAIKDFDIRNSNCNNQIEIVLQERSQFEKEVASELLQAYERITHTSARDLVFRKGIVPLQQENCGGCNLKVTPQIKTSVRKGEFVTCENCGTILFYGA